MSREHTSKNGLDPNSPLIVEYINSSYSKDGWANIHKEIGGFAEIMKDGKRPEAERVDAEGYYAICKFKIVGYLDGLEQKEQSEEISKLKPVLKEHFGLEGDISYKQIFDHANQYAEGLADRSRGHDTYANQSALNSALACILKFPFYDPSKNMEEKQKAVGERCQEYAKEHFDSATRVAELGKELGNGRGYTFLSTAYGFAKKAPPYAKQLNLEIPHDESIGAFCKRQKQKCDIEAANLGSYEAFGSLGEHAKGKGNNEEAEVQFKKAADGGINRYQYLLGELYLSQGKNEGAKHYLDQARENGFDVEGELKKSGLSLPEEKKQHTPEHKELGEQLAKSGVSMRETEPHYQRPTTSSLLKAGKLEEAMDHDPKFADIVRQQQGKGKGDGFGR